MDYIAFEKWLIETKGMKERSAKDVSCRCRRVLELLGKNKIGKDSVKALEKNATFENYTPCVKSQLKRAAVLWNEFGGVK